MKRYIRSAEESYTLYRNKRDENKYIEVRKLTDGHTEYRSFMFWNTDRGPVKNYYTSKSNKGRWHRGSQESVRKILEDYIPVESVEDGVKDDYSYRGAPENPNNVVASTYVQKLIRKRPKKDRNGNPLVYSGSGGRSLVGINYDSIDKFDSREEAEEDLRKYATKPSEWEVVEYEVEKSSNVLASTSSWPEELTYNDYEDGDQIIEVLIDVVNDLNLFIEESSVQNGRGSDFFYNDATGELLAEIDINEETEQLEDLYYSSKGKNDFRNKVRNWMIDLCGLEGPYTKY